MDLSPLRAELAQAIAAATTLPVATDPRGAHAPCVLVGPITDVQRDGPCTWLAEVSVYVLAPAPGDARSVDLLAAHITDVLGACGDESSATLGTYDAGQGDLPAYQITTTLLGKE